MSTGGGTQFGICMQVDFKGAAFAGLAVNADEAAMGLNDGMGGGQSQPGALADIPGGEEWFEDTLEIIRGNAMAGVDDAGAEVGTGHGIAGVDDEVENNLMELGGVSGDGPEIVYELHAGFRAF